MPIRFRCACGKTIHVGEQYAGRRATCPSCGAQLVVPSASTTPEAADPNAKAASSTQLPGAPALQLQLELEHIGPGDKTDDTAQEVTEIEEPAPESESGPVAGVPDESAPAAPSDPSSETVCPNCGAAVSPQSVICVECGANIVSKKEPAKKPSGLAGALLSLRYHKAFPLIAAVAAVVVILIATTVIINITKSHRIAQAAKAAAEAQRVREQADAQAKKEAAERAAAQAKAAAEKLKPPPELQYRWPGFSDPAVIARDRILKIGQELAAYAGKNHQPPATLAEAGATEADSAEYDYVGAEIAALPRFHAMAYEAKPSASHEPFVLFSDDSARPVPAAQIPPVLLRKTASGWLTAADSALLAKTAPVIRVANVRFASLEVALDDKTAGVAPRGGVCVIRAAAGVHQITFTAGGQKESFQADLKPGIVYTFVHPRQVDLPWIPMRQYRASLMAQPASPSAQPAAPPGQPAAPPGRFAPAPPTTAPAGQQPPPFTVGKREGFAVKSLKASPQSAEFAGQSVEFTGDGRSLLAPDSDLRSLAARIIRENENLMIEGPAPDKPILVNEIGRLEAGVIVVPAKGDITMTVTYRKTALGALRCEELPNMDPAAVSLPEAEQGKPPELKPGTTPLWAHKLTPGATRPPAPPPPATPPSEPTAPPQLTFPAATFTLSPDCEALAATLSSSAPDAVKLLLQRAQLTLKPAEAAPVPLRGPWTSKPAEAAPVRETEKPPAGVEPSLRAQEIPAPLVYGALAFYGDPSALHVLSLQCEKTPVESPAYPPLLLALARSGGMAALAYLRTASANAPTSAVIALSTIDDASARTALAEILADWTPSEVAEAVDEWPVVAGPACRIAFVETLASANPAILDDVTAINALIKFEPYALERALAARLATESNAPTPPAQAPAPPPHSPAPPPPQPPPAAPVFRSLVPLAALAHFENGAAVTRFVQWLDIKNDPAKRLRATTALGEVRDPSVLPLLTALLKDKEAPVRRAAARALAQMPDAAVVGALDAAMDKDLLVPAIAEQAPALAAQAGPEATAALLAKMLTLAIGGKAPEVKPAPGRRLTPAVAPAAASAVEPGMASPKMILEAVNRLGFYSPAVKKALEAARQAPDPAVRATAYKACEQAIAGAGAAERSNSAIAAAGLALKDTQGIVRVAGIGLLSAAEPQAALSLLLPALKDPDAAVRAAAVSALPEIAGDQDIAAVITSALSDPSPAVVSAAAHAAARRNNSELSKAVLDALNQAGGKSGDQSEVLQSLAEALADLQPQGAAGALANLLAPSHPPEVRAAAARALGKMKDATALNSLLSAAQDKEVSVVAAAIVALGELDAPEAVQATLDALVKEDLPPALRRQILMRLVAHGADPRSAYGSWAATGPALNISDLDILVSIAPSATAAMRPGLIALATRYLADSRPEARKSAASILANYTDDTAVRGLLLNALEKDATGVAQAAADVLRGDHDASKIDGTLLPYYKALCEGTSGPAAAPAPSTPSRPGTPAVPTTAPAGQRFPGLARAAAPDSLLLRAAIIEALGGIIDDHADHAGRALKTIADLEAKGKSDDMAPPLIKAFESCKASTSIRSLCELYVDKPDPRRLNDTLLAIAALTRMHIASLDPEQRVTGALQHLVEGGMTPPDAAAAAKDALEEIQISGGA